MENEQGLARVRRVNIHTGKGGKMVTVAQITDLHISAVNDDDMACEEIARTYFHRKWLRDGEAIPAAQRALDACRDADCTVVTGDLLDYYSSEAESILKRMFDEHPNIMACIGGHDVTLEMETGRDNELSLTERYDLLTRFWCNDVQYASKTLENKIVLVVMNNNVELWRENRPLFDSAQVEALRKDIERARREGMILLLFMHEPLFPGEHNATVKDLFDDALVTFEPHNLADSDAAKEGYDLIVSSADVIRGVFVGHKHHDFEVEIGAGYTENGKFIKKNIPQYGLTCNCCGKGGHVLLIKVD